MRTYVIIGKTYWHKANGHAICATTLIAQDRAYFLGIDAGSGDVSYETGILKIAEIAGIQGEYFTKMNALREKQKFGEIAIHHLSIPVSTKKELKNTLAYAIVTD